jgi:hypothetical protein
MMDNRLPETIDLALKVSDPMRRYASDLMVPTSGKNRRSSHGIEDQIKKIIYGSHLIKQI